MPKGIDLLKLSINQKSNFLTEIQQSKYIQILDQKDKEIKNLKRTIKKLQKQLKFKDQIVSVPQSAEGKKSYFKNILERQIKRYDDLQSIVIFITSRIKKLLSDINDQLSITQNLESMQKILHQLSRVNISSSSNSFQSESRSFDTEQIGEVENLLDQLENLIRQLLQKYGQTNQNLKQMLKSHKSDLQDLRQCKEQLKRQKRAKDLLQKLLEKNQTQKNEFVNQIKLSVNQKDIEDLKHKTKQEIISHSCQLSYRIKDLQQEKIQYMKKTTDVMHKQMKLYQQLLNQVKNFKPKGRSQQSVS